MTSSSSAAPTDTGSAPQLANAGIRIYAIDERPIALLGMAQMLGGEAACHWMGGAADLATALSASVTAAAPPEVVLLQHQPPQIDAVATVVALRARWPLARFIVIGQRLELDDVRRALDAGVCGLLPANVSAAELSMSVRAVHAGQQVVPPTVMQALAQVPPAQPQREGLTPRETRLLELMARGMDNRGIAQQLGITVPTVKFHITNIMGKLQAPNRTAAVVLALRLRLVSLNPEQRVNDPVAAA